VDTDSSVGITANGATTSVADNGGAVMTSLSGALPGSSGPSLNIGGDQVTTSIDVSLSYQGDSSGPDLVTDSRNVGLAGASSGTVRFVYWLWNLAKPCVANPVSCGVDP
jgi:hypothetical protein